MTFDELLERLVSRDVEGDEELERQTMELMFEVLNAGASVLNRLPKERLAAMISLVQTAAFTAAINDGDFDAAALTHLDKFSDALIYVFQATAGILTMEEVH